jgi:hypothetical protein
MALVQPDLFVADLAAFKNSGKWPDIQTLYLVIEVLSPEQLSWRHPALVADCTVDLVKLFGRNEQHI